MGKAMIVVVVVVLSVYSLFDVLAQSRSRVRLFPKPVWAVAVLIPVLGPLGWLAFGRPRALPGGGGGQQRPRVVGPDDDPDFLWNIDRRKRPRSGGDADPGGQPT